MPKNKNANSKGNGEIDFNLIEGLGTLGAYKTGWTKEANIVSWNGGMPKIDIRDWDPEHERMSRGVTLHPSEAKKLVEALLNRFTDEDSWELQGADGTSEAE